MITRLRDLLVQVQRLGMGTEEGSEADSENGLIGRCANGREQLLQPPEDCEYLKELARVEVEVKSGRGSWWPNRLHQVPRSQLLRVELHTGHQPLDPALVYLPSSTTLNNVGRVMGMAPSVCPVHCPTNCPKEWG